MNTDPMTLRIPGSKGLKLTGLLTAVVLTAAGAGVVSVTQHNPGLMVSSLVPLLIGYGIAWILVRAAIAVVVADSWVGFSGLRHHDDVEAHQGAHLAAQSR